MAIFRRTPPAVGGTDPIPQRPAEKRIEPTRAAPEPLAVILPAIAALGSIASIAAVAWLAQDRITGRPRVKRRIGMILKDLETSCLGTAEILRRVIRHSPVFGLEGATSAAPMKFGMLGTRVNAHQSQTYVQLVNDTATMLVLATQSSFDATNSIEDGDIEPPEALFDRFGEAQQRLNGILSDRASTKTSVETALSVAETLVGLVQQLKAHKPSEPKP